MCRENGDEVPEADIFSLNTKISERKANDYKKRHGFSHIDGDERLLHGTDVLDYFYLVQQKGNAKLRPMCDLFLGILPFIPTSVLCESSFSVYNTIMRADRTSLGNDVVSACVLLKSHNQVPIYDINNNMDECECFQIGDYRHIYPYTTVTHIAAIQADKIASLRRVCKNKYGGVNANPRRSGSD
jgi:hypothetical protein